MSRAAPQRGGWTLTATGDRAAIEAALTAFDEDAAEMVLAAEEESGDSARWRLTAYLPRRPTAADRRAIAALFPGQPPQPIAAKLPEEEWVSLSQRAAPPIRAGRFHVHTPDHPPLREADITDFVIPAARAFGTGQHATTAGCLAMLTRMKRMGVVVRNFADIGTGTGLLAFAAHDLWPGAFAMASDIDPLCGEASEANARANGVPLGGGAGRLTITLAAGMDHPLIAARGPYDLVIANILAGPLIDLADDFARAVDAGGHLVLAGLLATQEHAVRRAMFRAGFRLAARDHREQWSILWLRRRAWR